MKNLDDSLFSDEVAEEQLNENIVKDDDLFSDEVATTEEVQESDARTDLDADPIEDTPVEPKDDYIPKFDYEKLLNNTDTSKTDINSIAQAEALISKEFPAFDPQGKEYWNVEGQTTMQHVENLQDIYAGKNPRHDKEKETQDFQEEDQLSWLDHISGQIFGYEDKDDYVETRAGERIEELKFTIEQAKAYSDMNNNTRFLNTKIPVLQLTDSGRAIVTDVYANKVSLNDAIEHEKRSQEFIANWSTATSDVVGDYAKGDDVGFWKTLGKTIPRDMFKAGVNVTDIVAESVVGSLRGVTQTLTEPLQAVSFFAELHADASTPTSIERIAKGASTELDKKRTAEYFSNIKDSDLSKVDNFINTVSDESLKLAVFLSQWQVVSKSSFQAMGTFQKANNTAFETYKAYSKAQYVGMAKNTASLSGYSYATTVGDFTDKSKSALMSAFYVGSPLVSARSGDLLLRMGRSKFSSLMVAKISDFFINASATHFMGDGYREAMQRGVDTAMDQGRPDLAYNYGATNVFTELSKDVFFSLLTKPVGYKKPFREYAYFTKKSKLLQKFKDTYSAKVTNNKDNDIKTSTSTLNERIVNNNIKIADETKLDIESIEATNNIMKEVPTDVITDSWLTPEQKRNFEIGDELLASYVPKVQFKYTLTQDSLDNADGTFTDRIVISPNTKLDIEIFRKLNNVATSTMYGGKLLLKKDAPKNNGLSGFEFKDMDVANRFLDSIDSMYENFHATQKVTSERSEIVNEDGSKEVTISQGIEIPKYASNFNMADKNIVEAESKDINGVPVPKVVNIPKVPQDSLKDVKPLSGESTPKTTKEAMAKNGEMKEVLNLLKNERFFLQHDMRHLEYPLKDGNFDKNLEIYNTKIADYQNKIDDIDKQMEDYNSNNFVNRLDKVLESEVPPEALTPTTIFDLPSAETLRNELKKATDSKGVREVYTKLYKQISTKVQNVKQGIIQRANDEFSSIMKGRENNIDTAKVGEFIIEQQRGTNVKAEELYLKLNDDERAFIDDAKESLNDIDDLSTAWTELTGKPYNLVEDYWTLEASDKAIESKVDLVASDTLFNDAMDSDIQKSRLKVVDKTKYKQDAISGVKKFLNEKYKIIDFANMNRVIGNYFKVEPVRQELNKYILDPESATPETKELYDNVIKLQNEFKELRFDNVDFFKPSIEDATKQYDTVDTIKEIADGSDIGMKKLREIKNYNKFLEKNGKLPLNVIDDVPTAKNIMKAMETMGDESSYKMLGKSTSALIEPSQFMETVDGLDAKREGFGGNKRQLYEFYLKASSLLDKPNKAIAMFTKRANDLGYKNIRKVEKKIDALMNAHSVEQILKGKGIAEIHDARTIQLAQGLIRDVKKISKELKRMPLTTRPEKYLTNKNKEKKTILKRWLNLQHVHNKEVAYKDIIRNTRIMSKHLKDTGRGVTAHYWNRLIDEAIIGNQGAIDKKWSFDKWNFKVPKYWKPKMTVQEYREKLLSKGYAEATINKTIQELDSKGAINSKGKLRDPKDYKQFIARDTATSLQDFNVKAHLTSNYAWGLTTQPLSAQITGMRYGNANAVKALYEPFNAYLKDKQDIKALKNNPIYKIKRGEQGRAMPTAGDADIGMEVVNFNKTISDKTNSSLSKPMAIMEEILDNHAMITASMGLDKLSLQGTDRDIYISDAIQRTQSVYTPLGRAPILNNNLFKTFFLHKAYAFTWGNNIIEHLGFQKMEQKERVMFFTRAMVNKSLYSSIAYATKVGMLNSDDGSKEETAYWLIHNMFRKNGSTLFEATMNSVLSMDFMGLHSASKIAESLDKYYKGDVKNRMFNVSKNVNYTGYMTGFLRWVNTGNLDYLRKSMVDSASMFPMPLTKQRIGGAVLTNNAINSIIMMSTGEVMNGKNKIQVDTTANNAFKMLLFGKSRLPASEKEANTGSKRELSLEGLIGLDIFKKKKKSKNKSSGYLN